MPHGTVASERFDEFREHHTAGLGRNAIARAMGIPQCVASRTAEHLGLDFDRSRIQAATAARLADLAERRSLLAEDLVDDAERLRAQIWEPQLYWDWGGKDHEYDEKIAEQPTPGDKRALMGAAGMAIDRSLKLAPPDGSNGADEAKSMLGKLFTGIAALVDQQESAEAEDGE